MDPTSQPDWFSPSVGSALGSSASRAHSAAPSGIPSTDVFGTSSGAAADWGAPQGPQDSTAAFQFDASDFTGAAAVSEGWSADSGPGHVDSTGWRVQGPPATAGFQAQAYVVPFGGARDGHAPLEPATPFGEEGGHSVQSSLTAGSDPSYPVDNQDGDSEEFQDLMAMLNM